MKEVIVDFGPAPYGAGPFLFLKIDFFAKKDTIINYYATSSRLYNRRKEAIALSGT